MRGRDRIHVEDFSVGRVTAMEIIAIPGGHALRAVVDVFFRDVNPSAYHVRLTDTIHAAALRHRLARLDDAGTGCNPVARVDLPHPSAIRTIGKRQTAQAQDEKPRHLTSSVISPEAMHPASVPDRKPSDYRVAILSGTARATAGKQLVLPLGIDFRTR